MTCPNCQAQNLPGDRFCRSCGQPLVAAAAPVPAAPAPAAPVQAAPAPAAAAPVAAVQAAPPPADLGVGLPLQARRLSRPMVIGGVVALVLLVAGAGAALALVLGGGNDDGPPLPSLAIPTAGPTAAPPTVGPTDPGATPVPTPAPTPSPTAAPPELQLVDVANLSIQVPATWEVLAKSPVEIVVEDPDTYGLVIIASGSDPPEISVDEYQQGVIAGRQQSWPDAKVCSGPYPWAVPGGPQDGVAFYLCYTVTPEGQDGFPATSLFYLGVQGETYFRIEVLAHRDWFDTFYAAYADLPAPTWKLFKP